MNLFLQQIASGFATGCIYGCIALALVLIHTATGKVNFAQGEMGMLTTYLAWVLLAAGLGYWTTFAIVLVAAFVFGVAIERAVVRRVSTGTHHAVITVLVGLMMIMTSIAALAFTYTIKSFPSPFTSPAWKVSTLVSSHEFGMTLTMLSMLLAIFVFFRYTKLGLAMRASALEPFSSRLVGIPVARMQAMGWGMAAVVGAVAGMMAAPIVFLDPHMMGAVLIYGFAAALVGGLDSPLGAVAGGIIVGVVENLAGTYLVGNELRLVIALLIIVSVLLAKPEGLFGQKVVTRV